MAQIKKIRNAKQALIQIKKYIPKIFPYFKRLRKYFNSLNLEICQDLFEQVKCYL